MKPHPPYYRMKQMAAGTRHERLYQDMVAVFDKHARHLDAADILAIAANLLGKMIALQNQNTMTPAQAIALVQANIEDGNKEVIEQLNASGGTA